MTLDLSLLDLVAQADLVRRGELKPLELVDAAIERAEQLEPTLHAIVSAQFERARAEAASPELPEGTFRGVPFLLKDLGAYLDGDPVYCGMKALKQAGWRESGDAWFAARLKRAGLISLVERAVVVDQLLERAALEPLHRDVPRVVVRPAVEHRDQQCLAVGEALVEVALGELCLGADRSHRRPGPAALAE